MSREMKMSPPWIVLLNQEAQSVQHKNSHKKCWVINLSQYLMWPSIVCGSILLWFTRSHELLSNFSQQKQSQEFLFLFIFPSQFSTKSLAVQFVCLCVCCNVCFEIEIWKCLKVVGHHRGAQATAFSHGFPFFSLNLWRIFPVWRQSWQNS